MRRIIAIVGAIIMIFGAFLPVLAIPLVETFDFYNGGQSDGVYVVIAGLVAIGMAVLGLTRLMLLPGIVGMFFIVRGYFDLRGQIPEIDADIARELIDTQLMQSEGWLVMGLGAAILIVTSFIPKLTLVRSKAQA